MNQQHENARQWVQAKFHAPGKQELRDGLAPGQPWSFEVVLHRLKGPDQLTAIREEGIKTLRLSDIIGNLSKSAKESHQWSGQFQAALTPRSSGLEG